MSLPAPLSEPVEHEWVKIGPDKFEYRGFFISKSSRDWTVLEPKPSEKPFGYFKNVWDAEEAIDAFCDRGVVPEIDDGIPNQGASERMAAAAREE